MKNGALIAAIVFTLLLLFMPKTAIGMGINSTPLGRINPNARRRKCDAKGCGHFGASRDQGKRSHKGQDFLLPNGADVFAPQSGRARIFWVFESDKRYQGIEVSGDTYKVKIMYVKPMAGLRTGDFVGKGQVIAKQQDLSIKYGKNMPNHAHVEVWQAGRPIDPSPLFPPDPQPFDPLS